MIGWQKPGGLDSNSLAEKEKVQVDLKTREGQDYTKGGKLPNKKEMWIVYAILILVLLFMISAFFN